jgi:hypothetical protein
LRLRIRVNDVANKAIYASVTVAQTVVANRIEPGNPSDHERELVTKSVPVGPTAPVKVTVAIVSNEIRPIAVRNAANVNGICGGIWNRPLSICKPPDLETLRKNYAGSCVNEPPAVRREEYGHRRQQVRRREDFGHLRLRDAVRAVKVTNKSNISRE